MTGPLQGLTVLEFEGIGPGPVAGYFLDQLGAKVHLVSRPSKLEVIERLAEDGGNPLNQGKIQHILDIKADPEARLAALKLVEESDILIEGNRPGVMERLGLGPAECALRNPKLIYGRVTGYGQTGPLAQTAGHDLNYVGLTGLLSLSAHRGSTPVVPPTVLGDGVGGLGAALGLIAAYLGAQRTGRGQVVDAAILDITASVGVLAQWLTSQGQLGAATTNIAQDAPFYALYECACGGHVSVCAVEGEFFRALLDKLEITDFDPKAQFDVARWPTLRRRLEDTFASRSKTDWVRHFEGSDACVAPVLSMSEAYEDRQIQARGVFGPPNAQTIVAKVGPQFLPYPD